jgi:hypothetical protein
MLLEACGHTRTLAPGEHVGARYEVLRHGGDGAPATLPCGAVRVGHPAAAALIGVLPAIVHLGAERVERTLALMAAEARESVRG